MADEQVGALTARDLQQSSLESGQLDMFATRGFQDFLVTLPTKPNFPFEISHSLSPALPTGVRYELLQATFPTVLYHDVDDQWGVDYVVLRATAGAGAQVRIRLTVDDGDATPLVASASAPSDVAGFQVDGRVGAMDGSVLLEQVSESTVTDGSAGYGVRFDGAALYYFPDGADNYVKLSMDDYTPLQVRHTGTDFFLQPGPNSNVGRQINLGSPRESTFRGWFDKAYLYRVYSNGRTTAEGEQTAFTPTLTADAGTWTGGTATCSTAPLGPSLVLVGLDFENTTLSAAPSVLSVTLPFTASVTNNHLVGIYNGGSWKSGFVNFTAGSAIASITLQSGGAFTTGAGLYLRFLDWAVGN